MKNRSAKQFTVFSSQRLQEGKEQAINKPSKDKGDNKEKVKVPSELINTCLLWLKYYQYFNIS